jgi:hypothetical protein
MTRSRPGALVNEAAHFPLQIFRRGIQHRTPRVNHNVPLTGDLRQAHPQQFPDPPPGPVPFHRFPELPWHGEAQPWPLAGRSIQAQAKCREIAPGEANALLVDTLEIDGTKDSGAFRERETCRRTGRWPDAHSYPAFRTALSSLTDSLCRPLARRRASTARPSFVFMRSRKPCVLARLRLFG